MTRTATTFRRDTEAQAYRVLHEQGLAAFSAAHPIFGNDLLNSWHDRGLCRITWRVVPTGVINPRTSKEFKDNQLHVRTFKKYATGSAA